MTSVESTTLPCTSRPDHRRRRMLIYALWLLVVFLFVRDQVFLQKMIARGKHDLIFWCNLSADLAADPNLPLYEVHPRYLYPPFYLLLIRPLSFLPIWLAALVFETAKWAVLAASVIMVSRLCARPHEKPMMAAALIGMVLAWRFISNDMSQGNVNLFILAVILASCFALSRGHHVLAGAWIMLGVCIKLTPGLVLAYFLYKRWWKTAIGAIGAGVLFLLVLPGLWLGWAESWDALVGWYRHVILSFVQQGNVYSIHINQSLTAILNRLFGSRVAIEPDVHLAFTVLPWPVLNGLRMALSGLLIVLLGVACRRRIDPARQPLAFATEVGLVLVVMLMLSGYSWKAHFVTLLLPYAVLAACWLDAEHPARRVAIWSTGISFSLCSLTSDILTPRGADYAEAFGLIALGALAAAAGLFAIRSRTGDVR